MYGSDRETHFSLTSNATLLLCSLCLLLSTLLPFSAVAEPPLALPGLQNPGWILRDPEGLPHIYAENREDVAFLLGFAHASDRLFWMDYFRRTFDGTLSELGGQEALPSDALFRVFNLVEASQASYASAPLQTRRWVEAYAAGVNAAIGERPLPTEYAELEVTGVRPWEPWAPFLFIKGLSTLSWLDVEDINRTLILAESQFQGSQHGFDGTALFFEDLFRVAPVLPAVTAPDSFPSLPAVQTAAAPQKALSAGLGAQVAAMDPRALDLARETYERMTSVPIVEEIRRSVERGMGSNWWAVSGALTDSGNPILAADPHQPVTMPAILYPSQWVVSGRQDERIDASGVSFPGIPGQIVGCNLDGCWAATNTNLDASDIFQEQLIFDPTTGEPTHTVYQGVAEPLRVVEQSYRINLVGDGVADNLVPVPLPPLAGGKVFLVPRRLNGPLLSFAQIQGSVGFGFSAQYIGWAEALDVEAFRRLASIRNEGEFMEAVSFFNNFTVNMTYVGRSGEIVYAVGGRNPLRDDLQNHGRVVGSPPFMIRDGSGALPNEWIPASVTGSGNGNSIAEMPFEEMPQLSNPLEGFLLSSNNDPIGTSLDNDVFNQFRPDGGVLYLHFRYFSLRATQVRQQLERELAAGRKISVETMQRIQGNNQMIDAQLLTPYLVGAYDRALQPGADARLGALAADPRIAEAIGRLRAWDYSTPTGITEGYDPGDDPDNLQPPSSAEVQASIATTLYSVWRGQAVGRVLDDTLRGVQLESAIPDSLTAFRSFIHLLRTFDEHQGRGVSGLNFFAVAGVNDPFEARDIVMLESLQQALDLLAGDAFEAAFGGSTDQDDYRWGRLHRIVIEHVHFEPFDVPNAGGFQDLEPTLPGLARGGGMETIDAATHDVRAAGSNSFLFTVPAAYRMVAELKRSGIEMVQILPGGISGDPADPKYTNQLGRWLTHQYAPVLQRPEDVFRNAESVERFRPLP